MVLIISNKLDLASDLVVLATQRIGLQVVRLNLEDASQWEITVNPGKSWSLERNGQIYTSDDFTGVWCRRPGWPAEDGTPGTVGEFVNEQWMTLLRGMSTIRGPIWINDPFFAAAAENKLLQLSAASRVGIRIPETRVTNSATVVGELHKEYSQAIVKALSCPLIESTSEFIFTNLLTEDNLPDRESAAVSPFISQKALIPKTDIRATVIGKRIFAASADSTELDWRLDRREGLWQQHELPDNMIHYLLHLMTELNLQFGAIDLAIYEGQYYFLEINPTGEWAWIQMATGMQLDEAIADALSSVH